MNAQVKINPPATEAPAFMAATLVSAQNGFAILHGSIAPVGGILKLTGAEQAFGQAFKGTARVFDGEAAAMAAIRTGEIAPHTAIIIRGKADMSEITIAIDQTGIKGIALISDGRFMGQTANAMIVSHCAPAAQDGGPIGRIQDGDTIIIDAATRRIDTTADLSTRKSTFAAPMRGYQGHPALEKYARLVTAAS